MSHDGNRLAAQAAPTPDDEAAELFIQRLYGQWGPQEQAAFEARLETDGDFARAWKAVEEGWASLDRHAEAPEIMAWRADAIDDVRTANARRWTRSDRMRPPIPKWKIAAAVAGFCALVASWQLSPYGYRPGEYRTGIGEQRIVELEDHSRITMDAATGLRVRLSKESRTVHLAEGQAQFSVAKDPSRPFKVIAGDRTVVAVGTVFTVEYIDGKVHVAMLEGKVAVLAPNLRPAAIHSTAQSGAGSDPGDNQGELVERSTRSRTRADLQPSEPGTVAELFLTAGEALQVDQDGATALIHKADLAAATAWREGKVIFRTESLSEAVRRMNRYSRLQIEIDDPGLASERVSGVFEAGDTRGFVNALQRYLPVAADYSDADTVRLKAR
jgi:transmembrane sensor